MVGNIIFMREIANLRFIVLVFLHESYKYILSGPVRILQHAIYIVWSNPYFTTIYSPFRITKFDVRGFIGFHFAVRIYCN
jgi:hypothetical protein